MVLTKWQLWWLWWHGDNHISDGADNDDEIGSVSMIMIGDCDDNNDDDFDGNGSDRDNINFHDILCWYKYLLYYHLTTPYVCHRLY